ncbi:hypothetical protein ASA1KI_03680 [Opitutales bacterium ASA1]|nr:hypothetical protein ASA1KI_03680 [Opitutales bacterium ASA1]
MSRVSKALGTAFVLLMVAGCGGAHLDDVEAEEIAVREFRRYCALVQIPASDFGKPIPVKISGVPFAFEWRDKNPGHTLLIRVSVDESGLARATREGERPGLLDPKSVPPPPGGW